MTNVIVKSVIVVTLLALVAGLVLAVVAANFSEPIFSALRASSPYFAAFNVYIPTDTLLNAVKLIVTFEAMILIFKAIKWALS